jgi:hypothetical protein
MQLLVHAGVLLAATGPALYLDGCSTLECHQPLLLGFHLAAQDLQAHRHMHTHKQGVRGAKRTQFCPKVVGWRDTATYACARADCKHV